MTTSTASPSATALPHSEVASSSGVSADIDMGSAVMVSSPDEDEEEEEVQKLLRAGLAAEVAMQGGVQHFLYSFGAPHLLGLECGPVLAQPCEEPSTPRCVRRGDSSPLGEAVGTLIQRLQQLPRLQQQRQQQLEQTEQELGMVWESPPKGDDATKSVLNWKASCESVDAFRSRLDKKEQLESQTPPRRTPSLGPRATRNNSLPKDAKRSPSHSGPSLAFSSGEHAATALRAQKAGAEVVTAAELAHDDRSFSAAPRPPQDPMHVVGAAAPAETTGTVVDAAPFSTQCAGCFPQAALVQALVVSSPVRVRSGSPVRAAGESVPALALHEQHLSPKPDLACFASPRRGPTVMLQPGSMPEPHHLLGQQPLLASQRSSQALHFPVEGIGVLSPARAVTPSRSQRPLVQRFVTSPRRGDVAVFSEAVTPAHASTSQPEVSRLWSTPRVGSSQPPFAVARGRGAECLQVMPSELRKRLLSEPAPGTRGTQEEGVRAQSIRHYDPESVLEFMEDAVGCVQARVVSRRPDFEDPTGGGTTHELEYLAGRSGRQWVCVDEARKTIRSRADSDGVPYRLKVRALERPAAATFASVACVCLRGRSCRAADQDVDTSGACGCSHLGGTG
eukprot:CAMPEP_0115454848 /NCGR_PEP_ID=MMETSP0271-20121206/43854_1 /TAXON_ID=71861 /ORGANISM="Scrippsiella trochoidea, Strain CCMP3099" /LENGTH=618 /DNA_ID=CAMNT_0002881285 /DNA_START=68 /DNA_END=1921 /DNA_ORIENTATION=-